MINTQARHIGEAWSYIRDNAKGISENDGRELFHICKVEFLPPSKTHLKRLKRKRPLVLRARPEKPKDETARRGFNHTRDRALAVVAILRPNLAREKRHGAASLEMFSTKHKQKQKQAKFGPFQPEPRINYWRRRAQGLVRLTAEDFAEAIKECGGLPLADGFGVMVID